MANKTLISVLALTAALSIPSFAMAQDASASAAAGGQASAQAGDNGAAVGADASASAQAGDNGATAGAGASTSAEAGASASTEVNAKLLPLPARVVEIVPQFEGYLFFVLADGRIVIAAPDTLKIVAIITV